MYWTTVMKADYLQTIAAKTP